jgi:hypothetical protein
MTARHPARTPAPAETWTCAECGASNRAAAEWCGQCFSVPSQEAHAPDAGGEPEAAGARPATLEEALLRFARARSSSPARPGGADTGERRAGPSPTPVQRGAFRAAAGAITWTCTRCDETNDLAENVCAVCGTPFAEVLRDPGPERPARDPGTAALLSLLFPGAGHAYVGAWGQAIARGIVSAWACLVVLFALFQGGRGTLPAALAFGAAAFLLWVAAAHDAFREAQGAPESALVKPKHFLFLVLGLLGLQVGALVAGAVAAG